jgi:hypothetical protein
LRVVTVDYTNEHVRWAVCGICVLFIVALVAIASYAARSRLAFFIGSVGAFLGFIVPEPVVYKQYRSAGDAFMGTLMHTANHLVLWGIAGSSVGWAIGVYVRRKVRHRAIHRGLR